MQDGIRFCTNFEELESFLISMKKEHIFTNQDAKEFIYQFFQFALPANPEDAIVDEQIDDDEEE
jgi:hypothetical protein